MTKSHYALRTPNTSAPWYDQVDVASAYPPGQLESGSVFVPRTPESFTHDPDGNLLSDGRWDYTWDGENRLIRMVARTAAGPQQRLEFAYDWQGRRIAKVVWNNTAGTGTPAVDQRFLYDQWNLIVVAVEVESQFQLAQAFVWGTDLSGSMQGAGGVGGLLKVSHVGQSTTNYFTAFDGNGNVVGLVDASSGAVLARYEYGPFGELVRATGPMAKVNPFRFSTKYQDEETGLLYYGYRYYDPRTGSWLSRDPVQERGGVNLYAASSNDLIQGIDYLGLKPGWYPCIMGPTLATPLSPWTKHAVWPSGDWTGVNQFATSSGITIIYKRQINATFTCFCPVCPSTPKTKTKVVWEYLEIAASNDSQKGPIFWNTGPPTPWPPLDLMSVAIDFVNGVIHPPTPVGPGNQLEVDLLVKSNTPLATTSGRVRPMAFPGRFCFW